MAMTATAFLSHFKQVKAYLDNNPGAPAELKESFAAVAAAFRAAYSAEALKQALAANAPVDVNLEDRLTSTLLLVNRERARQAAAATAANPAPE